MPLLRERPRQTQLTCPREGRAMRPIVVDGLRVERCDGCGGTWFDAEAMPLATRKAEGIPFITFDCPRCDGGCLEGWIDDVRVDVCASCHGVWLDRGELDEAKRRTPVNRHASERGSEFRMFLLRI